MLTIDVLTNYLGSSGTARLEAEPFRHWRCNGVAEADLREPLTDYCFVDNGMDFVCDHVGAVNTIFLYNEDARRFTEAIEYLPITARRPDVISRFGEASQSGSALEDSVLGQFGPWDRFDSAEYPMHIEYDLATGVMRRITLMRAGTVP